VAGGEWSATTVSGGAEENIEAAKVGWAVIDSTGSGVPAGAGSACGATVHWPVVKSQLDPGAGAAWLSAWGAITAAGTWRGWPLGA